MNTQHDQELHDDDKPIGRVLTRREVLALLGGAGAAFLVGGSFGRLGLGNIVQAQTPTATPLPATTCVVQPQLTEGPYFVDTMLNRSDIRVEPTDGSIKEGVMLNLIFRVSDVRNDACAPLPNAQVDIWHCDALGQYSGVADSGFNTEGLSWLRGYQITDKDGIAQFVTNYPGWYSGRAVHIHFKIRTDPEADSGYEFTSQLFFDDDFSNALFAANAPYNEKGDLDTPNSTDGIYQQSGDSLQLTVEEIEGGYQALFDIALDFTQAAVGGGQGQGGGQGGPGSQPPNGTPPSRP